jgi:hypothetical protein
VEAASIDETRRLAEDACRKLLAYCESHDWSGVDPYDALNSRLFKALPVLDRRLPRLALTQLLKRSPANIRSLLLVPPTRNPKALALFLGSLLRLSRTGVVKEQSQIGKMVDNIAELRSPGFRSCCWGYSFPWQTRTLLVPRAFPNLVCTTFVADALVDAFEQTGERRYLEMAESAAGYILDELYWSDGPVAGFGYPLPSMKHNIHNGNLLGAALFCRVARQTGERRFLEPALKVARYSASRQREDGSWAYGELPTQSWIDNFHTGYNLCALRTIGHELRTTEFEPAVARGLEFYRDHFFLKDGTARYYHDKTYPIDIHCVAQSILTLLAFRDQHPDHPRLAESVFRRAMDTMWDERGFFYYRVMKFGTIRTSYMRWSQAWMLLALSMLLVSLTPGADCPPRCESAVSV